LNNARERAFSIRTSPSNEARDSFEPTRPPNDGILWAAGRGKGWRGFQTTIANRLKMSVALRPGGD
jgi:hypothetical protein